MEKIQAIFGSKDTQRPKLWLDLLFAAKDNKFNLNKQECVQLKRDIINNIELLSELIVDSIVYVVKERKIKMNSYLFLLSNYTSLINTVLNESVIDRRQSLDIDIEIVSLLCTYEGLNHELSIYLAYMLKGYSKEEFITFTISLIKNTDKQYKFNSLLLQTLKDRVSLQNKLLMSYLYQYYLKEEYIPENDLLNTILAQINTLKLIKSFFADKYNNKLTSFFHHFYERLFSSCTQEKERQIINDLISVCKESISESSGKEILLFCQMIISLSRFLDNKIDDFEKIELVNELKILLEIKSKHSFKINRLKMNTAKTVINLNQPSYLNYDLYEKLCEVVTLQLINSLEKDEKTKQPVNIIKLVEDIPNNVYSIKDIKEIKSNKIKIDNSKEEKNNFKSTIYELLYSSESNDQERIKNLFNNFRSFLTQPQSNISKLNRGLFQ